MPVVDRVESGLIVWLHSILWEVHNGLVRSTKDGGTGIRGGGGVWVHGVLGSEFI